MSAMRLSTLSVLVFGAALAMVSTATLAQTRTFSFAYDQPKSSGYGAGAEMFDKKLKELSKGTLSINQYPSAQLGTEAQTMQKVQTGDIDFVMLSTANASTAQPESGVFSIHFIFRDEKHAIKVLGDPKVIAAMKELYAAKIKGAHMLGLGSQGLRHMYGKKPVQKVADLKGVKMRVQATVTEDTTFPAYGAQVVHMDLGERVFDQADVLLAVGQHVDGKAPADDEAQIYYIVAWQDCSDRSARAIEHLLQLMFHVLLPEQRPQHVGIFLADA
jgi:TRAP-type C4-dicarboxylate transport system substrate-binding protein